MSAPDWKTYQETAATFFRSLGLDAKTDAPVPGVRTSHDVDVLVKSRHAGFEVTWLVECKHWNTRISKLHVLGLRQIVIETGADRGIILAENGYQAGAIEAAHLTNVHLTSLEDFQKTASADVYGMRLRELFDRIESANQRYWDISKKDRIESGLRPDVTQTSYSGAMVIKFAFDAIGRALRGIYPFELETQAFMVALAYRLPPTYQSAEQVISTVSPLIDELEGRLDAFDKTKAPPAPLA